MARSCDVILSDRARRLCSMPHVAQVILSYLSGFTPIGQPIELPRKQIMADCGYRDCSQYYKGLNHLIKVGCVQRVACSSGQSSGVLVVLKHYEEWRREAA